MPNLTQLHLSWHLWQLTVNLLDLNINSQNSKWELWSEKFSGKISQKHFLHFYVNNSSICSFVRNLSDLHIWCSIFTIARLWGFELNQQTVKSSVCMHTDFLFFKWLREKEEQKGWKERHQHVAFIFHFHIHTHAHSLLHYFKVMTSHG